MAEKITNIARNTSYFTLALIVQKVISLAYFTIYARELGPADLGQFYFAISVTSIFGIFIDFGMSTVLTREIAKEPGRAKALLSNALAIKFPLTIATVLALIVWSALWDYNPLTQQLIYISGAAMILDYFTNVFYATSRGFHNLKYESIASVIFQCIVFGFSMLVLSLGWGIQWLMVSLLLASAFNCTYAAIVVRKRWKVDFRPRWDSAIVRHLFLIAAPFAFYAIFQRIYTYFDSVLLFKLAGDSAVGLYQIPFKIMVALQFLPMAFVASLYPALSSYWHNNREQLMVTFERAFKYTLIIAAPIAFGVIALAEKLIVVFKSQYTEAALPLQICMLAVPFMFLGFPVGSLLNACDRQKRNTVHIAIVAIGSVILNLFLIPRYGVIGASITNVVTSALMLLLGWIVIPRIMTYRPRKYIIPFIQICAAAAVMGFGVYWLKESVNVIILIGLGALVYAIALFAFGGFTKADVISVYESFLKKRIVQS